MLRLGATELHRFMTRGREKRFGEHKTIDIRLRLTANVFQIQRLQCSRRRRTGVYASLECLLQP
jgi:RNase P/RNase MRP subunit POP5